MCSGPFLMLPWARAGRRSPSQVSPSGLADIPGAEDPSSQRRWELEDEKLGRNAIIWETDERKRDRIEVKG